MTPRTGPRPTSERVRRLLVLLPWLMERGEVPVREAAERFGLEEKELVRDLELAAMCGLPPFIDEMVDVYIDEGTIYTGVPRLFTRPLRITAPEGFALLTAARVAMQLPGADTGGALARALEKLAAVLGDDGLVVETSSPEVADMVHAAAAEAARLQIEYWSAGSDRHNEREITPRRVFLDRGYWYVIADDHLSGERRTFRLDRIARAERTGVLDEWCEVSAPSGDQWFQGANLPTVTLRLPLDSRWVAERYPTVSQRDDGDHLLVELTVASERWLEELLLRLGTRTTVVSPSEYRDVGARAARSVLARYSSL